MNSASSPVNRSRRGHPTRALAGMAMALLLAACSAPDVADLRAEQAAEPSTLLDSEGNVLATYRRGQRQDVSLDRVSPHVVKALVATEDRRFYEHDGVDLWRTLGAVVYTVTGDTQGGSTITQQLARNMFPEEIGRSRTPTRKVKEMITARRIEKAWSKQQILEAYLNTVPFLYNVVGIEMAARTYFDKTAAELDVLQAATLVGMLKGTYYYNPVIHPKRALDRRNVVLAQMVKSGDLPQADFERLKDRPLGLDFNLQDEALGAAPHFAAFARKWLSDWAEQHGYDLYRDGLVVHTTIDRRLQEAATEAVEQQAELLQKVANAEWSQRSLRSASSDPRSYAGAKGEPFAHFWAARPGLLAAAVRETPEFRKAVAAGASAEAALDKLQADAAFMTKVRATKTRLEAGFVAMDPATGAVKAWVGSRDFARDQFDHVAQAERQPGSTFKAVVYGAALEQGIAPDRTFVDAPIEVPLPGGKVWRPTDMSGTSGEPMTLREGLVRSKNTITAQVMQEVGVDNVVRFAKAMGVTESRLDPVPSLALGTSPVTLLEMVNVYSTIAAEGRHHLPLFVTRISDHHGKVLAEFAPQERTAMSRESAVELIDMLRGVVNRGTGTQVKTRFGVVADVAGKTGTTQNNTDGWFILMHPRLVAGAWVGFNDSRVTLRSTYWGQGGHNAILLVGDFFRRVLKAQLVDAQAAFPPPVRPASAASEPLGEGWAVEPDAAASVPTDEAPPPVGQGVLTGQDGEAVVIGEPAAPPPSAPASGP
jgi:penicillin-binding protein 1A